MDSEEIQTVLLARTYFYQVCQVVFGDDPSEELLDAFFSEATEDAFSLFTSVEPEKCAAALAAYEECKAACAADRAAFLEKAQRDYMHQLIGPNELKAPPWECVYISKERMLFQESTLRVRQYYRSEGFLPTQYPHVSDDHIAIELDFMAKLGKKSEEALTAGEDAEYKRLLGSQRTFLTTHLLKWVADYAADLAKEAPGSLYACAAAMCAAVLPIDADLLGELGEAEEAE